MKKIPVSVVMNTLNEGKNIVNSLGSVSKWASELLVVDMYSDDDTVAKAKALGARILYHERVKNFDIARDMAIRNASEEWVLLLDADEQIPIELSRAIDEIITADAYDVAIIPRLNYMFGSPVHHSGWGPDQDAQIRLFRKNAIRITGAIHDFIKINPGSRVLRMKFDGVNCIHHYNYLDISHHIVKINSYTTVEAIQAEAKGDPASVGRMFLSALREFIKRYVVFGGYKDGWRGLQLSVNIAVYRMFAMAKLIEIRHTGGREYIEEKYAKSARELLDVYNNV